MDNIRFDCIFSYHVLTCRLHLFSNYERSLLICSVLPQLDKNVVFWNFISVSLRRTCNSAKEEWEKCWLLPTKQIFWCLPVYNIRCIVAWHYWHILVLLRLLNTPMQVILNLFFLSVQQFVCSISSDVPVASASFWSSSVTPFQIALTAQMSSCAVRCLCLRSNALFSDLTPYN